MAAVDALLILLGLSLLLGLGWFLTRRRARRHYGRRYLLPESEHGFQAPKPAWVRAEIIRLKAQGSDLGCRTIAMIFNRRHAARGMSVGKTFVSNVIRQHHYQIQVARRTLRRRKLRPGPRNRVWGLDLTGKTDAQGQLHALLGILDHGTRASLALAAVNVKVVVRFVMPQVAWVEMSARPRCPG